MKNILSDVGFVLFLVQMTFQGVATAAGFDGQSSGNSGSLIFLGFLIVFFTRKREIGGWLLYFYLQIYGGFLFSMLFISQVIENLSPANWDDTVKYLMFVFSTVPSLVISVVILVFATYLLISRSEKYLKLLRLALIFGVAFGICNVIVDFLYFSDFQSNLFFDGLTLFFNIVWSLYFFRSIRVRKVFVEKSWFLVA